MVNKNKSPFKEVNRVTKWERPKNQPWFKHEFDKNSKKKSRKNSGQLLVKK